LPTARASIVNRIVFARKTAPELTSRVEPITFRNAMRHTILEAPAQGSLFGEGENRLQLPVRSYLPDPDKVRQRMLAVLEKARSAKTMPWLERDAWMWQTIFPNMANWLPQEEADQLRFEFAREMERLKQAA
jgi:hypothetical protein